MKVGSILSFIWVQVHETDAYFDIWIKNRIQITVLLQFIRQDAANVIRLR